MKPGQHKLKILKTTAKAVTVEVMETTTMEKGQVVEIVVPQPRPDDKVSRG